MKHLPIPYPLRRLLPYAAMVAALSALLVLAFSCRERPAAEFPFEGLPQEETVDMKQ